LQAGRLPADRWTPAAPARTTRSSHRGAAGACSCAGGRHGRAGRRDEPAPSPARAALAGGGGGLARIDSEIALALLEDYPTPLAGLLAPMPRIGGLNLAQILAEVGPVLDRAVDVEHACAEVGAAPVTRESGKGRSVHFRWAVNTRARQALSVFADNSRHSSPWAANLYAAARARGKRHPHAIRILMRAWVRVMWACWHSGTPYNPVLHGGERRFAA